MLREIGEDAPVVSFIGVRQGRAGNPTTESHVVELAAHRSQARLNVAETLAVSELREGHRQILIPARQTSVVLIAVIASHTLLELEVGEMSDQLRENGSAGIHPPLFRRRGVQPLIDSRFDSARPASSQTTPLIPCPPSANLTAGSGCRICPVCCELRPATIVATRTRYVFPLPTGETSRTVFGVGLGPFQILRRLKKS